MTYQKILAALDGSSQGEAVFNQAIAIANPIKRNCCSFMRSFLMAGVWKPIAAFMGKM